MNRSLPSLMLLVLVPGVIGRAESLRDRLTGTWVKDHAALEGGHYPGDADWVLEVTFSADGRFRWQSTRVEAQGEPRTAVDDSLSGRYSVQGVVLTYTFDPPSPEASPRLSELFAYGPRERRGLQTIRFQEGELVLVHDASKLWIYLKRK